MLGLKGLLDLASNADSGYLTRSADATDDGVVGRNLLSKKDTKTKTSGRTAKKKFCKYLQCDPDSQDPVGVANAETGPALPCGKVAAVTLGSWSFACTDSLHGASVFVPCFNDATCVFALILGLFKMGLPQIKSVWKRRTSL